MPPIFRYKKIIQICVFKLIQILEKFRFEAKKKNATLIDKLLF